jgi:hypothetical protein
MVYLRFYMLVWYTHQYYLTKMILGVGLLEKQYGMHTLIWLIKRFFGCQTHRLGRRGIFFKNHLINIKKAPEPSDIIWENLSFSIFETFSRRVNGFIITLLMIFTSAFLITLLTYLEHFIEGISFSYEDK